jgi:hypothetical protein
MIMPRRPWWILAIPLTIVVILLLTFAILAGMPYGRRQSSPRVLATTTTVTTITVSEAPPPAVTIATPAPPMASAVTPPPEPAAREISEGDAVARLRSYIASYDPYDVPRECLDIRSAGYASSSYTLEVLNLCGPQPAVLGRWRVDAITREVRRSRSR